MSEQTALAQGNHDLLAKLSRPKVAQFIVQLSLETPVEQILVRIVTDRQPIRVGRLRYVLGSELLTELLMRGAEALELEYPGALGLSKHLEASGGTLASETAESVLAPEPTPPLASVAKEKPAKKVPKNPAPELFVPKLDLSGIDFGSAPVHPKH